MFYLQYQVKIEDEHVLELCKQLEQIIVYIRSDELAGEEEY